MKLAILFLLVANNMLAALPENQAGEIANAIYKIEGGNKTKHPYGVKSVKTKNPRAVCVKTIQNTHNRWLSAGKPGKFLDFLANRYCPPATDSIGNSRWKKNIRIYVPEI